ncbi:MAG: hypothetical protein ACRESX_01945 [Gammaproteobacteria bacterium]
MTDEPRQNPQPEPDSDEIDLREVEHVLGRLRQNNIPVTGFVLNDLMPRSAAYGYRKYGYAYSYKYSGQKP